MIVGIASTSDLDDRDLGHAKNTVGYHSNNGSVYCNGKSQGNMAGKAYGKGDAVGVEVRFLLKIGNLIDDIFVKTFFALNR